MVDEFLVGFKNCFSLVMIPKMHNLARILREIRTLESYWFMRYEAKHGYLKKLNKII
jgi:hypothetical protein